MLYIQNKLLELNPDYSQGYNNKTTLILTEDNYRKIRPKKKYLKSSHYKYIFKNIYLDDDKVIIKQKKENIMLWSFQDIYNLINPEYWERDKLIEDVKKFEGRKTTLILSNYKPPVLEIKVNEIINRINFEDYEIKIPYIKRERKNSYYLSLSKNPSLTEELIEEFKDKLVWKEVCKNATLSEEFIEKNLDRVDWDAVSKYQSLSEEFIIKHSDKVDWNGISSNQNLSEEFIIKHSDKVNWNGISSHQKLSEEFINNFKDRINFVNLLSNKNSSESLIRRILSGEFLNK